MAPRLSTWALDFTPRCRMPWPLYVLRYLLWSDTCRAACCRVWLRGDVCQSSQFHRFCASAERVTGKVKMWNDERGFGFIIPLEAPLTLCSARGRCMYAWDFVCLECCVRSWECVHLECCCVRVTWKTCRISTLFKPVDPNCWLCFVPLQPPSNLYLGALEAQCCGSISAFVLRFRGGRGGAAQINHAAGGCHDRHALHRQRKW